MTTPLPPVHIALTGGFQQGKSLLVNCLLGRRVAAVGNGLRTTPWPVWYQWGDEEKVEFFDRQGRLIHPQAGDKQIVSVSRFLDLINDGDGKLDANIAKVRVSLAEERLKHVVLIDTPGINHDADDDAVGKETTGVADLVLFLAANRSLSQREVKFIREIGQHLRPLVVVFNCADGYGSDGWSPLCPNNQVVARNVHAQLDCSFCLEMEDATEIDAANLFNLIWWALAENVIRDLEKERRRWGSYFDKREFSSNEALQQSRGEAIRRFVFAEPERYIGWNARCLGILHREIREWQLEGKCLISNHNQGR